MLIDNESSVKFAKTYVYQLILEILTWPKYQNISKGHREKEILYIMLIIYYYTRGWVEWGGM